MVARGWCVRLPGLLTLHRVRVAAGTSLLPITVAALLLFGGAAVTPVAAQCSGPSCPSVTPDGGSKSHSAYTSGHTAQFTVKNLGSGTDWYSISCLKTGQVTSCSPSTFSVQLGPQQQTNVTVTYAVGGGGSGTVRLRAFSFDYMEDDQGYYNVTVTAPPAQPNITPDGTSTPRWEAGTTGLSADFTVSNVGGQSGTFNLTCIPNTGANVTCTGLSQSSVTLAPSANTTVTAYYNVGAEGQGTLTLETTGQVTMGHYNVQVGPPANWDVAPFNQQNQSSGRCALSCFGATFAYSTVPYFTQNTPRSVTLLYNSNQTKPTPLVQLNVKKPNGSTPTEVWLQVKRSGAYQTFVNNETTLRFQPASGYNWQRIGGQLKYNSWMTTGRHAIEIIVTYKYSSSQIVESWNTHLLVVNEEGGSPMGKGWTLAGLGRVIEYTDGAMITSGDGSAVWYKKNGSNWDRPAGEVATLTKVGSNWQRTYPDGAIIFYRTSDGKMTEIRPKVGGSTLVGYNGLGQTSSITDPAGKTISLTYITPGDLWQITDPYGRVTQLSWSADRLQSIKAPNNTYTNFTYYTSGATTDLLRYVITPSSDTTEFVYETVGMRLSQIKGQAVTFYGIGTPTKPVTTFAAWQRVVAPNVSTSSTKWSNVNPDSVWAQVTSPEGRVSKFSVDRWGQPRVSVDPVGLKSIITYDPNGFVSTMRNFNTGAVDTLWFDSYGKLTQSRLDGRPSRRTYIYGAYAQLDSAYGGGEPAIKQGINSTNGLITWRRVNGSQQVNFTAYEGSQVKTASDAAGHNLFTHTFNSTTGNTTATSRAGNVVVTYGYDTYGRRTSVTPAEGGTATTYYDALNRPDSMKVGGGKATKMTYGAHYTEVRDAANQLYRTEVNGLGWVAKLIDPTSDADEFKYNKDGELREWKNREAQVITETPDVANERWVSSVVPDTISVDRLSIGGGDSSVVVTAANQYARETTYLSARGLPDSLKTYYPAINKTFWARYYYSSSTNWGDRLDSIKASGPSLSFMTREYKYDGAGRLEKIELNNQVTDLNFNADGVVAQVTFPSSDAIVRSSTHRHDDYKQTTTESYNGLVDRYAAYDSIGRLAHEIGQVYSGIGQGMKFAYDDHGRLIADTLQEVTLASCADEYMVGGLVCSPTAWGDVLVTNSYAYDSVGNRKDDGGQYTTGNRITAFGSCTAFAHDDNGNMTSRTCGGVTTTYTWRKDNKLASVSSGGTTYYLRYDAVGRLTRLDQGGAAIAYFLWQGSNLLAELNGSGTAIQLEYSYYPGLDNLHAVKKDSVWMAHKDPRGNVIALTNSTSKSVGQWYRYSSWGELSAGGGAAFNERDRARWKGALWFDEIGLYYKRARWYDPSLGRFISEDPIGLAGGINPYAFASGDPINGADPSGLLAKENPFDCQMLECWVEWTWSHCTFVSGVGGVCGSEDAWVLDPINVVAWGGGGSPDGGLGVSLGGAIYRSLGGGGHYRGELKRFWSSRPDPFLKTLADFEPCFTSGVATYGAAFYDTGLGIAWAKVLGWAARAVGAFTMSAAAAYESAATANAITRGHHITNSVAAARRAEAYLESAGISMYGVYGLTGLSAGLSMVPGETFLNFAGQTASACSAFVRGS